MIACSYPLFSCLYVSLWSYSPSLPFLCLLRLLLLFASYLFSSIYTSERNNNNKKYSGGSPSQAPTNHEQSRLEVTGSTQGGSEGESTSVPEDELAKEQGGEDYLKTLHLLPQVLARWVPVSKTRSAASRYTATRSLGAKWQIKRSNRCTVDRRGPVRWHLLVGRPCVVFIKRVSCVLGLRGRFMGDISLPARSWLLYCIPKGF